LANPAVETPEHIADQLRGALNHTSPNRLIAAPNCGMQYLPRNEVFEKLRAMVGGVKIICNKIFRTAN